jgi:hypothetical protein
MRSTLLLLLFVLSSRGLFAQETAFDVAAYRNFLDENAALTGADLRAMHDAGIFRERAAAPPLSRSQFSDSIDAYYHLTSYEKELIARHGFMVTERVAPNSFGLAFKEIYVRDLPVFISTDAILHALHMSYDAMLMQTEEHVLIPKLDALLTEMRSSLAALAAKYDGIEAVHRPLRDMDVYLTVPLRLLRGEAVPPLFAEDVEEVEKLLSLVEGEAPVAYRIFAENCRDIDFSQFTPRGHYTRDIKLTRYFRAMMWLGRIELYLTKPKSDGDCQPSEADVQRQTIGAALLAEAADANILSTLEEIDRLIALFVGESDNLRLDHFMSVMEKEGLADAAAMSDEASWRSFQEEIALHPFAKQRILSQILYRDPMSPEKIEPASALMLLGQRFVIDSYVTGQVVFDRIEPSEGGSPRMLPSSLDVLFALGNDAAGQLLQPEFEQFGYAPNLAALRYLIDEYDDSFWDQTLYNGWLNSIRTLRPPAQRDYLPPFMQTAAWWQQKMNTQLSSWAQLRHDNLLYAKQSYTGGIVCEFPFSYVEPIPAFFEAVSRFAKNASSRFSEVDAGWASDGMIRYFDHLAATTDTLGGIATKELSGTSLSSQETGFLRRMLRILQICGPSLDGWYPGLYYSPYDADRPDMVVADVHTAPTDEAGSPVGWVLHAGTGPLNMAVLTADIPGNGPVAFVGPVMSYYEHVSTNFKRLTDEEWQSAYAADPSIRPEFVNLYLADRNGEPRGETTMKLATTMEDPRPPIGSESVEVGSSYPNPFAAGTTLSFTVPSKMAYERVRVDVYDVQGRLIETILEKALPAGTYSVRWDGTLSTGVPAAAGAYVFRVRIGEVQGSKPVVLVR